MRSFIGKFRKLGNLSKFFIDTSVGGNKSSIVVVDENDSPLEGVSVEIESSSGGYSYTATTNAQGEALLRGTFNKKYTLTMNKDGMQEKVISDWVFVNTDTITYD